MGGLPSPEVGSVHSEQKRRLRLAFLGIALDHAAGVTDALQAGPAGLLHHLSHLVEVATDVAASHFHGSLAFQRADPWGWRRRRGRGRRHAHVL